MRCEININTTKVIKMAEKSNTYGDKSCKIPPEGYRGKAKKLSMVFLFMLFLLGMTSCYPIHQDEKFAVYRYSVNLHYQDGGAKVRTFDTNWKPYIATGYKSGFPRFYWTPIGDGQHVEDGVCRFEIISRRDITEEYYGKKIISSREYWNPWNYVGGTLHKLGEK